MPTEHIGNIAIPTIAVSGTPFPFTPDDPYLVSYEKEPYIHRFGMGQSARTEQRFVRGNGARLFTVTKRAFTPAARKAFLQFWEDSKAGLIPFHFLAPNQDGSTTDFVCRFAEQSLSLEYALGCISSVGLGLRELPDLSALAPYTLNSTVTRFPSDALATALLNPVQECIPLVKIQVTDQDYPAIYLSDRRVTIGSQLYQPRIVDWDGIGQTLGNASDGASFQLGNADRVMRDLANDVDLYRASLEFSLFHVGTGIKIVMWVGYVIRWHLDASAIFQLAAADGIYEVSLPYPTPKISRWCDRAYNKAGTGCDWAARSGAIATSRLVVDGRGTRTLEFPKADADSCDKSLDGPNGCMAHFMEDRFQGIVARPQTVKTTDNSTGVFGFGRSALTSLSLVSDTIYEQVLPEVWCKVVNGDAWLHVSGALQVLANTGKASTTLAIKGFAANAGTIKAGDRFGMIHFNAKLQSGNVATGFQSYTVAQDAIVDGAGHVTVSFSPGLLDDVKTNQAVADNSNSLGVPVNCKVAEGRDEGDFFSALGIVCRGPIGAFAQPSQWSSPNQLDGQNPHGWNKNNFGLRQSLGPDPVISTAVLAISLAPGDTSITVDDDLWFASFAIQIVIIQSEQIKIVSGLGTNTWTVLRGQNGTAAASHAAGLKVLERSDDSQWFSLGEGGSGPQYYSYEKAAGVAFTEIRRTDQKGLQPSAVDGHKMQSAVRLGMYGFTWSKTEEGGYVRNKLQAGVNNPVWIIVNMLLRARGLWFASAADQEKAFVVDAAFAAAAECDLDVPVIIGAAGTETQFTFNGTFQEEKPLRDWIAEVSNNFLGYTVFSAGKLRIGIRADSSVVSAGAFTEGNIIFRSLVLEPARPEFNYLTGQFADIGYDFGSNSVSIGDDDHAELLAGGTGALLRLRKTITYGGTSKMSQCARLITTRLREELGGINPAEWKAARRPAFKTTVLSLGTEVGMVCSITHPDMPAYPEAQGGHTTINTDIDAITTTITVVDDSTLAAANTTIVEIGNEQVQITFGLGTGTWTVIRGVEGTTAAAHTSGDIAKDPNWQPASEHYGEFRMLSWRLNKDYSIDIAGRSTHNDMYNLVYGPKPADQKPVPIAIEDLFAPENVRFSAHSYQDGKLYFDTFACGNNAAPVHQAVFSIYYIDEVTSRYGTVAGSIDNSQTSFIYAGPPPVVGEWVMADAEIMEVLEVEPIDDNTGTVTVIRGALGTAAAAHDEITANVTFVNNNFPNEFVVDAGAFRLGAGIVGGLGQSRIGFYNPVTHRMISTLPVCPSLSIVPVQTVFSDVRLWRISKTEEVVPLAPRFFSSPQRANFVHDMALPFAGVVLISGVLENTRGIRSVPVWMVPVSSTNLEIQEDVSSPEPAWPYRVRTLGTHRYEFHYTTQITVNDGFVPLMTVEAQPFEFAQMRVSGSASQVLNPPSTPSSIVPSDLTGTGVLTIAGTINDAALIQISVTGGNELAAPTFVAEDHGIDGNSTAAAVATALAAWLNSDANFATFYTAAASANLVTITDLLAFGGTVVATVTGGVTVGAAGFTPPLGVTIGRRYAFAFKDADDGYLSALSPLTLPVFSGDATRISVKGLPQTVDGRVTAIQVYATENGSDTKLHLLAELAPNTPTYDDTANEATLAGGAAYPGESQPTLGVGMIALMKQNGNPWFGLRIPAGASESEQCHGFALDPVDQQMELNADLQNGLGDGDLSIFLE